MQSVPNVLGQLASELARGADAKQQSRRRRSVSSRLPEEELGAGSAALKEEIKVLCPATVVSSHLSTPALLAEERLVEAEPNSQLFAATPTPSPGGRRGKA